MLLSKVTWNYIPDQMNHSDTVVFHPCEHQATRVAIKAFYGLTSEEIPNNLYCLLDDCDGQVSSYRTIRRLAAEKAAEVAKVGSRVAAPIVTSHGKR